MRVKYSTMDGLTKTYVLLTSEVFKENGSALRLKIVKERLCITGERSKSRIDVGAY